MGGVESYVCSHILYMRYHSVMTTVVVPLLLSYFVPVKGVFSPVPPYCGIQNPLIHLISC